ncbi:crosslink repair DNA glycosylase YcaQ family protein [Pseudarthrobacter sp. J75]|uniref:winged helix-turn-helix domain-containing protein n=1 Tax=unclassified Pseudarthrobacter TaxID=2647000 RepID=UPI002E8007A9|nr:MULTISPECIES: crosslink repair DNA glycosylase YcaQ family protein [unclassified Pseudarthrobacter]MEE2521374.1 crosslink repair DNA glycosylase YcaQ family protein [Pseudarthrobacter sp. J47]MEE2528606.1 crosslink repair DNA glycosylase YcaQ family protein [Pseudarthrobacter sp. J75]
MASSLSLLQARRIALAAQGLDKERPTGPITPRTVGRTFARIQLVQIDSVNVVSRSHYLPFFSRLGNYDRGILERMAGTHPRRMMEYWAHEASFIRPEHFGDLLLWQRRKWAGAAGMDPEVRAGIEARIIAVLDSGPPLTAAQLTAAIGHLEERQNDHWGWNWNAVKRVLEHLFQEGTVSAASRTTQFERRYTLTSRVLPAKGTDGVMTGGNDAEGSMVRLIDAAAQAHGIGTVRCFADYFRTPVKAAEVAVRQLVEQGRLEAVTVDGWNRQVFRHAEARLPRKVTGRALLSPFDSLVFERRRLEELFGFHYRIEIYTPQEKRRFGYYVLPFLLRDAIVARVDLKADRAGSRLLVRAAYAEPAAPADTAVELAAELQLLATWLELDDVVVEPSGDLSTALSAVLEARSAPMLSGNSVGAP